MKPAANSSVDLKAALIFPGQGAQYPGMGADLIRESPPAKRVFETADQILGYGLSEIMTNEDPTELNRTVHTQPAVYVYSMALFEALKELRPLNVAVASGHSLGEYSALTAADSLSFEEALSLIQVRAGSMDKAQPQGTCGMAAILGMAPEDVYSLIEKSRGEDTLEAANFNAPGQVVISGRLTAIERAMENINKIKGAKGVMLQVSSAFHTSLMGSAKKRLEEELKKVTPRMGQFPVIANVNAEPYSGPYSARELLSEQVIKPVLWSDCVKAMQAHSPTHFIEVGPGKTLTGLMRRIDRKARAISVSNLEEARLLVGNLS
jgi:[acyl-carrier-protein] S-malonyltransferase